MNDESRIEILSPAAVAAKLKRMAIQIYEHNYLEAQLTVLGVDVRGGWVAEQLCGHLRQVSPQAVHYAGFVLDREALAEGSLGLEIPQELIEDRTVIVVDDVLYTGFTLLRVLAQLVAKRPRSLQTAVLIDRGHRMAPVGADVVGMVLATTLQQHVSVEIPAQGTEASVWLS